jgi:hypothetical protein
MRKYLTAFPQALMVFVIGNFVRRRKSRSNHKLDAHASGKRALDRPAFRAFSGEVDTGSPSENAITQREIERIPIPSERDSL